MWENLKKQARMRIGWMEYIRSKKLMRDAYIYLSLGSKEERAKNPLMSTVGDCTRETYELLKKNPAVKKQFCSGIRVGILRMRMHGL
ncbi:MAG: hypothetical protein LUG54_08405 [Clostridiales bacterium]|nr:hypothetical protein [Clostridiales bacterium]